MRGCEDWEGRLSPQSGTKIVSHFDVSVTGAVTRAVPPTDKAGWQKVVGHGGTSATAAAASPHPQITRPADAFWTRGTYRSPPKGCARLVASLSPVFGDAVTTPPCSYIAP